MIGRVNTRQSILHRRTVFFLLLIVLLANLYRRRSRRKRIEALIHREDHEAMMTSVSNVPVTTGVILGAEGAEMNADEQTLADNRRSLRADHGSDTRHHMLDATPLLQILPETPSSRVTSESPSGLISFAEPIYSSSHTSSSRQRSSTYPYVNSSASDLGHQLPNPHDNNDLITIVASSASGSSQGEGSWLLGYNQQPSVGTSESVGTSRYANLHDEITAHQKQLENTGYNSEGRTNTGNQEPPPGYSE